MKCEAKKKNGERCGAAALSGERRCSFHSAPGRAAALGRKGGLAKSRPIAANLREFAPPATSEHVRELVSHALVEVRSGAIAPKVANALGLLAGVLLKAIDQTIFEERLTRVEKLIQRKDPQPRKEIRA